MIEIDLKRLPHGEGLPLPSYATGGAAGLDVVAAEDVTLAPGERHAVATGFAIAIPEGHEVQVRPRSGLAIKHGITCLNTPGTIDHDYRGEVKVILANLGTGVFEVARGERIAQLVPAPVLRAQFLCGIAFVLGLLTRWAGLITSFVFIVAVRMVHWPQDFPGWWPALILVFLGILFATQGPGRYALDSILAGRRDDPDRA